MTKTKTTEPIEVSDRDRGTISGMLDRYGPERLAAAVRAEWAADSMGCRDAYDGGPVEPRVESRIEVAYVRGGQPRAYADHERVHRVTFFDVDYLSRVERPDAFGQYPVSDGGGFVPEDDPWWEQTDGAGVSNRERAAEHDAELVEKAKQILGVAELRVGHGSPTEQTTSEWFGPWLDYATVVEPGVVEVRVVTPYID